MKRLALALALLSAPLAAWADCTRGAQQAMTCAEGMTWDAHAGTCVPIVTG